MNNMHGCAGAFAGNAPQELSKGLKQLKEEHPPLLKMLDNLFALCEKVEHNEERAESFAKLRSDVESFLAELEPHSEKEEGVLFPMMGAYIGHAGGPIAVMEYEHDQAKTFIGTFLKNTKELSEMPTEEEMEANSELIKRAYYTLVDHFAKEENVLFPMAENMLTDEEKNELAESINAL